MEGLELQLEQAYEACKSAGWCNDSAIKSSRQLGLFYRHHSRVRWRNRLVLHLAYILAADCAETKRVLCSLLQ
jgi:hypothetical protein